MRSEGYELKIDDKAVKELAKVREIGPAFSKEEFAKMQKEMAKAHDEMRRALDHSRAQGGQLALSLQGQNQDFGKLMKSLSDKQWELHKKQGFLKFSDLTEEQSKIISHYGKRAGSVTISVNIDGKTLTLKN